jgi:hypothetical protein
MDEAYRRRWVLPVWDEVTDHYVNVVFTDGFYGEHPHANVSIKIAPVQFHPLPINLSTDAYSSDFDALDAITGSFDMSDVDYSLIFDESYKRTSMTVAGKTFFQYTPVTMRKEEADIVPISRIEFRKPNTDSGGEIHNIIRSSMGTPDFHITGAIYLFSTVYVMTFNHFFVGTAEAVGILTGSEEAGFWIRPASSHYNYPNIDIIIKPEEP